MSDPLDRIGIEGATPVAKDCAPGRAISCF